MPRVAFRKTSLIDWDVWLGGRLVGRIANLSGHGRRAPLYEVELGGIVRGLETGLPYEVAIEKGLAAAKARARAWASRQAET